MKKEARKKLYRREQGGVWYMDYDDPVTGERKRKSTGTRNEKLAREELDKATSLAMGRSAGASLRQVMSLYTDPATNPRKAECEIEGSHYGLSYAKRVACTARWLISLFEKRYPSILKTRVCDIKRLDCRKMREIIVKECGRIRTAQERFRILKTFFSQLYREGSIDNDPCKGLSDIKYEERERFAIDEDALRKMIGAKELFFNDESWAFFTILATTGMRKGEVLALSKRQISGNDLIIDKALKSDNKDDLGKPKCEKTRVIRLSKITMLAIDSLKPDKAGRFFHHSRYWADKQVTQWKVIGKQIDPETPWEDVTPHILRHSLNTLLVAYGLDRYFIAEYLGWRRQSDLIGMQRRYTHILTKRLQEVADKIDELLSPKNEDEYYRVGKMEIS